MKLPADVADVLTTRTHTDGKHLILTGPRFDQRLYQRVNEVLEAVGGRWTTAVQAHVFQIDAAQAIAATLAAGEVVTAREKRQQAQYFPTPPAVVARLVDLADVQPGMRVLEPSAGSGAIAAAVAARGAMVDCIERDPGYAAELAAADVAQALTVADFLAVPPQPVYDRVVMNPPFTQGADMAHVQHALRFLAPGGLLVSVMSWTVTEHEPRTAGFRDLVEAHSGTVEAIGAGAFAESGTAIPTVIVTIPAVRPAGAAPTVWPERTTAQEQPPEFGHPADIAAEIGALLRKAASEFEAVATALARPTPAPPRTAVVELPAPRQEQLALDGLDEAS